MLLLVIVGVVLGRGAGEWLVVDSPQPADAIVVLAGETEQRPVKGLQMLSQGLAPKLVLDTPAAIRVYRWSQLELAQQYLSGLPEASRLSACPIVGLSTKEEAQEVAKCIAALGSRPGAAIHSVLLVTSDFHTRRALAVFRHEIPGVRFSVGAAYDATQFGPKWWQHRQWAKTFSGEVVRLVWWYAVDQWRK